MLNVEENEKMEENPGMGSPFWKGYLYTLAKIIAKGNMEWMFDIPLSDAEELLNDPSIVDYFTEIQSDMRNGFRKIRGTATGYQKLNRKISVLFGKLTEPYASLRGDNVENAVKHLNYYAFMKWHYPWVWAYFDRHFSHTFMWPPPVYELQNFPDYDRRQLPRNAVPYDPTEPSITHLHRFPDNDDAEFTKISRFLPDYNPQVVKPGDAPPKPDPDPDIPTPPPTPEPEKSKKAKPMIPVSIPPDLAKVVEELLERDEPTDPEDVDGPGQWTIVESLQRRKDRLEKLVANLGPLIRLSAIHEFIRSGPYVWQDKKDADVFTSAWLIKNGSVVLKGVPGTGKTQLIEMTVMFFANDILECPEADRNLAFTSRDQMMLWLEKRGIIGTAKHNQDKELQDIYFSSAIDIETYRSKDQVPLSVEVERDNKAEGNPPPPPPGDVNIPTAGLEQSDYALRKFYEDRGFRRQPDTIEAYSIRPIPRSIVTAMIKFHNEANRMNTNVADALLGLMAEGEVEMQGTKFLSPASWDKNKGKLDPSSKGVGSLNIFDYNPHLEVEYPEMELDRALLDRITVGMFLPAGDMSVRFSIMETRIRGGSLEPREKAFRLLKEGTLAPITRAELESIWKIIPMVPTDAEVNAWCAFVTNIANMSNRTYNTHFYHALPPPGLENEQMSKSEATFAEAITRSESLVFPNADLRTDVQSAVDSLQRPLGMRSAQSMIDVYKGLKLLQMLRWCRSQGMDEADTLRNLYDVRIYVTSDDDRQHLFEELMDLAPYILDHRINLGVDNNIKLNFLSVFHLFRYYFKPMMLEDERRLRYFAYMKALMYGYVKYRDAKGPADAVIEWFDTTIKQEYNNHSVDGRRNWTKPEAIEDRRRDSCLQSLFSMARTFMV